MTCPRCRAENRDAARFCREVGAATAQYDAARALAHEPDMCPLAAQCHLGLGRLYRRTGHREPAREHLTTATAMYREMGMAHWLELEPDVIRGDGADDRT